MKAKLKKSKRPLKISTHVFRQDLKAKLAAVARGREVEITRYGKTVARLVPVARA